MVHDKISEDTTPSHEIHLQDDISIEITMQESTDHGEHSEQPTISPHKFLLTPLTMKCFS